MYSTLSQAKYTNYKHAGNMGPFYNTSYLLFC